VSCETDSLRLQQTTQERATTDGKRRGRRRKGQVIDLDMRLVVRTRRRKWLMVLLTVKALVAVIAVCVLVGYLVIHGHTLQ
jgi:hypothetical protein